MESPIRDRAKRACLTGLLRVLMDGRSDKPGTEADQITQTQIRPGELVTLRCQKRWFVTVGRITSDNATSQD